MLVVVGDGAGMRGVVAASGAVGTGVVVEYGNIEPGADSARKEYMQRRRKNLPYGRRSHLRPGSLHEQRLHVDSCYDRRRGVFHSTKNGPIRASNDL